ncbi:thioredoxin family protein [Blastopirellula sp. JC732]|uniref:Thioredoxin family protein n=1 Tax=Blastopirellula sediminis TaxID=2894196 RepID=A0A9X1SFB8_9BACT|nr:thioredoxin family protein [Blastopirellula sediminis]MCC9607851.1 thioredoxin family protein [Blastopirellula sediminis]MCC9627356.1 thioredoxin family protein [Blastopirellula sediminis]
MKKEKWAVPSGIANSVVSHLRLHARVYALALPLVMTLAPVVVAEEPAVAETEAEEAAPLPSHVEWMTDVAAAQALAKSQNKDLILFFTGSDWCGFCVKLEKAVLLQPGTAKRLEERYVPVVLDFPHGKPQSEELKKQNDELKKKLAVRGFPTLYFVDADLMPQGQMVGYKAPEDFWNSFDEIVAVGEKVSAAKAGAKVAEITDYKQLNAILEAVPEEVLKSGWMETMRKTIDASRGVDDAIAQKWSEKLEQFEREIAEQQFNSDLAAGFMKLKREGASPEDVLAYFDEAATDAADYPSRVLTVKFLKMRYLSEVKKYDEGIAIANEILASEAAGEREKMMTEAVKKQMTRFKEQGQPAGVPAIRMIKPGE